jgi:hypothetical protein
MAPSEAVREAKYWLMFCDRGLDLKGAKSGTFLKDTLSQIAAIKSCQ